MNARSSAIAPDDFILSNSWAELADCVGNKPVAHVLADPSADGRVNIQVLGDLIHKFPTVPFLAYIGLTAPECHAVVRLSKMGLTDVIVRGFDDNPSELAKLFHRSESIGYSTRLFSAIAANLEKLPIALAHTLHNAFEKPHLYPDTVPVCREAGISMGTLYRVLEKAGLCSPKQILIAARVLRGYAYLLDPGASVQGVAKKLGYCDARGFAEHVGRFTGESPSSMRKTLTQDDMTMRLKKFIQRNNDGPGDSNKTRKRPRRPSCAGLKRGLPGKRR